MSEFDDFLKQSGFSIDDELNNELEEVKPQRIIPKMDAPSSPAYSNSQDNVLGDFLSTNSDLLYKEEDEDNNNYITPALPLEEPVDVVLANNIPRGNAMKKLNINEMLTDMLAEGGSDLFITADTPPRIDLHNKMTILEGYPTLTPETSEEIIFAILSEQKIKTFQENKELDTAHEISGLSRFRVNVYFSKGTVSAVIRPIPVDILTVEELDLPNSLLKLAKLPRGLVIISGPTGSGKTTTLAAIIDYINRNRHGHLITIEDPIEYVHTHKGCLVSQREIGADTDSFANALRAALREKPEFVLVGEMRDYETIALAITIAETGHLVFGTLHTNSAPATISRIVDVFPADQQDQIRTQLAASIQAIICQTLVRKISGGRVAALEILFTTQAIKTKITKNQLAGISSEMQVGKRLGMQTMDSHLLRLANDGIITYDDALDAAQDRLEMMNNMGGEEVVNKKIARQNNELEEIQF